jgi:hypothetical protein
LSQYFAFPLSLTCLYSTLLVASCRRHPRHCRQTRFCTIHQRCLKARRLLLTNARVRQKMQGYKTNCRMQGVLYLLEHSSCHGICNQPQAEAATTFLLGGRVSEKYVMRDWCPTGLPRNLASNPLLARGRKSFNHQRIGSAVQRPWTHNADWMRSSKKTH